MFQDERRTYAYRRVITSSTKCYERAQPSQRSGQKPSLPQSIWRL